MSVSDGLSNRQLGLQWDMSVSDGSQMKHAKLSDQAFWSPMGLQHISDGHRMKHVGLKSGISVSDGSPIGLRWVVDCSAIGL